MGLDWRAEARQAFSVGGMLNNVLGSIVFAALAVGFGFVVRAATGLSLAYLILLAIASFLLLGAASIAVARWRLKQPRESPPQETFSSPGAQGNWKSLLNGKNGTPSVTRRSSSKQECESATARPPTREGSAVERKHRYTSQTENHRASRSWRTSRSAEKCIGWNSDVTPGLLPLAPGKRYAAGMCCHCLTDPRVESRVTR